MNVTGRWLRRSKLALLFAIAAAAWLALTGTSFPHEWYPVDCCSGNDCNPIADSRVKRTSSGDYIVDGRWTFQRENKAETRRSLSGRYHACFPTENERPKCVFVPPDEF